MAKSTSIYICQQCGFKASQYYGKCPECNTWNSLVETIESSPTKGNSKGQSRSRASGTIVNLKDVEKSSEKRVSTTIGEFDRVLGGGIVNGSIVLISGDPGIGKSTLLTQLALNVSDTLYVAGEESPRQIKLRADRIKPNSSLKILSEIDVDVIISTIEQVKPQLVIIDSIQTLVTSDLNAAAGSISQVRECSYRLQQLAKSIHCPIFLVGHITKEGTVAGPKTLEHLVDAVLTLEGESTSNFRILRTTKNRFGATDEVGIFEMAESGMIEVSNPSQIFLEHKVNAPGSVVVSVLNGVRPLLIEIQALVTKSYLPSPRRVGTGIDNNRLQLLVAVLAKRCRQNLHDQDIFVNITGGLKIAEPAADLGICLAIVSSFQDRSIDPQTVIIGEVGLLGEVRPVRGLSKRVSESKQLGYPNVISPENVKSVSQALTKLLSKNTNLD